MAAEDTEEAAAVGTCSEFCRITVQIFHGYSTFTLTDTHKHILILFLSIIFAGGGGGGGYGGDRGGDRGGEFMLFDMKFKFKCSKHSI